MFENKWEIDSLASFMGLSYQYWHQTGDDSFVNNSIWISAVDRVINTIKIEQAPTFNPDTGTTKSLVCMYIYLLLLFR